MQQIWSPWRIDYVRAPKPDGCVFCSAPQQGDTDENLILFRGEHAYVMMNRYPYTNGHLMVIPYAHLAMLTDVPGPAQIEMLQEINMCIEVLRETMRPHGFNVGLNLGASAGAGIQDHLHFHVVPRWSGDTNFMAVIGETNVIVEGLRECFGQLKPAFDCRCAPGDPAPFRPQRQPEDDAPATGSEE
jgi:ATP adenylyltransferase